MRLKSTLAAALLALSTLNLSCTRDGDLHFSGRHINPTTVRIGTWDLRYLGPSNHSRIETRSGDDLAAYIAESGVQILALNGVGQTDGTPGRNATLDAAVVVLNQQGHGEWQYLLFPTQSPSQTQLTGIAWNSAVVRKERDDFEVSVPKSEISPADDAPLFDRIPHAVKFSAGHMDFIVVPIHLQQDLGPGDHIAHRVTEVKHLVTQVDAIRRHFGDDDIILLGSFNIPLSSEPTERLITQAGLKDLNTADTPTQVGGGADDRIYVPATGFPEATLQIIPWKGMSDEAFKRRLSDHYITAFDLRVTKD